MPGAWLLKWNPLSRSARCRSRRGRLSFIEDLEPRVLLSASPTIYMVNSLSDTGTGSGNSGDLRYCITQANANPNTAGSTIEFDPSVFNASLLESIVVRSPLDLTETAGPIAIQGPAGSVTGEGQIEGSFANAVEVSGANSVAPFDIGPGVTATFSALVIANGLSSASGGAVLNAGTLSLNDCVLSQNTAAGSGGAIQNNGSMTISGCYLAGNTAQAGGGFGGAIVNNGNLSVSVSYVVGNMATGAGSTGGAIYNAGTLDVRNTIVDSNSVAAGGYGGGIANRGAAAVFESSLSNNQTGVNGVGGGVFNLGHLGVANCEFDTNSASYGGGIGNVGNLSISYSTLYQNTAAISGGGIYNASMLNAVNLTIASNTAATAGGGGGLLAGLGSATLLNTIVAGNTDNIAPNNQPADDIAGLVDTTTSQFNLVGTGGAGGLTNGVGGNQVGVANPGLESFGSWGGATQTIAPRSGSPAVNAGGNVPAEDPLTGQPLTTDGRGAGFVRMFDGGVDIGAYELQPGTVMDIAADWGSAGEDLLHTAADGLRLLPAGRSNDLPWLGIDEITVAFNQPEYLSAADVTISSQTGTRYGPVKLEGPLDLPPQLQGDLLGDEGAMLVYHIFFAHPIDKPDRVTITIAGKAPFDEVGINTYARRLDILPGDFFDTGVVTARDITAIRNESTGKHGAQPTIFGEITGDGTVSASDFKAARRFQGHRLPKLPKTGGKPLKVLHVLSEARQHKPARPKFRSDLPGSSS